MHKDTNHDPYSNLTVAQLRYMAKEKGLKGVSSMRKSELCNLLSSLDSGTSKPGILRKRPADALLPLSLSVGSGTILVYIKPSDRNHFTFPCTIESGKILDYEEHDKKISKYTTREEYANIANLELAIEKELLVNKPAAVKKIRFNV